MNPMHLMKLKGLWDDFVSRHPKFPNFIRAIAQTGIKEGSILELKVTDPDGKSYITNIKVAKKDLQLFQTLQKLKQQTEKR